MFNCTNAVRTWSEDNEPLLWADLKYNGRSPLFQCLCINEWKSKEINCSQTLLIVTMDFGWKFFHSFNCQAWDDNYCFPFPMCKKESIQTKKEWKLVFFRRQKILQLVYTMKHQIAEIKLSMQTIVLVNRKKISTHNA